MTLFEYSVYVTCPNKSNCRYELFVSYIILAIYRYYFGKLLTIHTVKKSNKTDLACSNNATVHVFIQCRWVRV